MSEPLLLLMIVGPVAWAGILTRAATLKIGLLLAGAILWLAWRRSQSARPGPQWLHGIAGETLLVLFALVPLGADGVALWIGQPPSAMWQALPLVLVALGAFAALAAAVPPPEHALPGGAIALAWSALGAIFLITLAATPGLWPTGPLAALPLLSLPWSVPRLMAAAEASRPGAARLAARLTVGVLALLLGAGLFQGHRAARAIYLFRNDQTPWTSEWTAERLAHLGRLEARFAQPQGEAALQVANALALAQAGEREEANRLVGDALAQAPDMPAAINAACWLWARAGLFEPLVARIDPAQVTAHGSLEAARCALGALIAADEFGRARVIHTHFGDDLFVSGHPVLTPQRIGTALVAWDRPADALAWFSNVAPEPWETAESLFWRGLAQQALGHAEEARQAWTRAQTFAPNHADVAAHLDGTARGLRADVDLLPHPVAGRQLARVTLTPITPETLADPLVLRPGMVLRLDCEWRLTNVCPEAAEVRLRLGSSETELLALDPTERLVSVPDMNLPDTGGERRRLGERVRSTATMRIPDELRGDTAKAQLVVSTAPGATLPQVEVIDLAPLASQPGFRVHDPRDLREGISARVRMDLFGRGSHSLHLGASLQGTESALHVLSEPVTARGIALVNYLSGARNIPQDFIVAEVFVSDQHGSLLVFPLRAGRETADIWHEYPPFLPTMPHTLGAIAIQRPRTYNGHTFANTWSQARFDFGRNVDVRAIRVRSLLPETTSLGIIDVVLLPPSSPQ